MAGPRPVRPSSRRVVKNGSTRRPRPLSANPASGSSSTTRLLRGGSRCADAAGASGHYGALQEDDEGKRTEAADIFRTLVEEIVLAPVDGKVEIDARGDLAGILTLSVQTKNPAGGGRGHRM
jgi:hypothetical protein